MTIPTTAQLHAHRNALLGLVGQLKEETTLHVSGWVASEIEEELSSLFENGEGLSLPKVDLAAYFVYKDGGVDKYHRRSLISVLERLLARIAAALEERTLDQPKDSPVTFPFVQNPDVRKIVERDYRELQRVAFAGCAKSQLVLAGSCIEGLLYDVLIANESRLSEVKPPPRNSPIDSWTLGELIRVCVSLKLVGAGVEKLAPGLRDYRNLIHPAAEIRERLVPGIHEAEIAVQILHILRRDLGGSSD